MKREELECKLKGIGVYDNAYSLYGIEYPDATNLKKLKHKWLVYDMDERGNRYEEGKFNTEDEACDFIYQKMVRYQWVMNNAYKDPKDKPTTDDVQRFIVDSDGHISAILKNGEVYI